MPQIKEIRTSFRLNDNTIYYILYIVYPENKVNNYIYYKTK